jgi:hypothetical protein
LNKITSANEKGNIGTTGTVDGHGSTRAEGCISAGVGKQEGV